LRGHDAAGRGAGSCGEPGGDAPCAVGPPFEGAALLVALAFGGRGRLDAVAEASAPGLRRCLARVPRVVAAGLGWCGFRAVPVRADVRRRLARVAAWHLASLLHLPLRLPRPP